MGVTTFKAAEYLSFSFVCRIRRAGVKGATFSGIPITMLWETGFFTQKEFRDTRLLT